MRAHRSLTFRGSLTGIFLAQLLLTLTPVATQANHVGPGATIDGFDVEGDYLFQAPSPGVRDWSAVTAGTSFAFDVEDSSTDDSFSLGSKEQDPDGFVFVEHSNPGKDDLTRIFAAGRVESGQAGLYLGFERADISGTGDAHANFEFNQKTTTILNSKGFLIPERSPGDVLVVYDFDGGNKAATIEVRRWNGTALSGTWVLQSLPSGAGAGDVNLDVVDRPAGYPHGGGTAQPFRFGEAALDLDAIFGSQYPGCPGIAQMWAKTRSSGESFNSALKDRAGPVPFDLSRCPDVHIDKATSSPVVESGDDVAWTVTGTNDGVAAAGSVTMTDDLPDSLADVTATYDVDPATAGGNGNCSIGAGNQVSCPAGTLAASDGNTTGAEPDTVVVTIRARTSTASCPELHNTATIASPDEPASDQDDNTSSDAPVTVHCPNVSIQKSAADSVVSAGDVVRYTVTVSNAGPGEAMGVVMTDQLPSNVGLSWSIESMTGSPVCAISASALGCTKATLAAGAFFSVTVASLTTHATCGAMSNSATFTSANGGQGSAGPVSITVQCPDVTVHKSTRTPFVTAGDEVSYSIEVSNTGPGVAYNVTVSDSLPGGLAWALSPAVPGCSVTGQLLSCSFASMASESSVTLNVAATTTAENCGTLRNVVAVSATNEPATAAHNNSAGPVEIVVNCATIDIVKTSDDSSVSAGDLIGFAITVRNTGAGTAHGVVMTDPLPDLASIWTVESVSSDVSCQIEDNLLTCNIGSIGAGESRSVHVVATTSRVDCGTLANIAGVTTSNDGSDYSTAVIVVLCPDLFISKSADASVVTAGDPAGFTINIVNLGPGDAYGVTVTDPLPLGFTWTIAPSVMGCEIAGGTAACSFGTLAAGESRSVHIASPTSGLRCGPIQNVASAASSNSDSVQASATTLVDCPIGIQILKTGVELAHAGDTVPYGMAVSSTTVTPLSNVTVTDPNCDEPPRYVSGDDGDATLEFTEVWYFNCSRTITAADADPLPNTATANGFFQERRVSDTDDHVVDVIHPAIDIEKTVAPVSGSPGTPIVYTYVVTNTGDTTLYDVTVTDDKLGLIGVLASLDSGASKTLHRGSILGTTGVVNIGTAVGTDILGKKVLAADPATTTVVLGVKLVATGGGPIGWRLGLVLLALGAVALLAARKRERQGIDQAGHD